MHQDLKKSIANYAKMGIDIEVLEENQDTIKVKIAQNRLINGYMLNQKQLVERAKEVFKPMDKAVRTIPVVYQLSVAHISAQWIKQKMQTYGIHRKDLIKQLAVDASSLSLYLSGERKMNKLVKVAFYYYFLSYELNEQFRKV